MAVIEEGPHGVRVLERLPVQVDDDSTEHLQVPSGPMSGDRANLPVTPWTLLWFDAMNRENQKKFGEPYPGGITQFIEDCVLGFFKSRGKSFPSDEPEAPYR
jgi:hypothetical protein